jgi:hypothetical protein
MDLMCGPGGAWTLAFLARARAAAGRGCAVRATRHEERARGRRARSAH